MTTALPRPEALRLLAGRGNYTADIERPRLLHLAFLRSPYAHAIIDTVNIRTAAAAPGVSAVLQARDLAPVCRAMHTQLAHVSGHRSPPQPPLADGKAVWQGEPVVAVVAASRAAAEDALELIDIVWQPLPALIGTDQHDDQTPPIHAELSDNNAFHMALDTPGGNTEPTSATILLHRELHFGRQTGVPLEPRSLLADYRPGDDSLCVYQSHQAPHLLKSLYAELLAIPEQRVRVICADVGGAFGTKLHLYGDELATVAVSKLLGRPVQYLADRLESFAADAHAREFHADASLTLHTGNIHRLGEMQVRLTGALGAYSIYPRSSIGDGIQALTMSGAAYRIEALSGSLDLYYRNQTPTGAYRGVGQPLACALTELLIDDAAHAAHIDPLAFRRAQYLNNDTDLPQRSPGGLQLPKLSLQRCLDTLCELMNYQQLRRQQQQSNDNDNTGVRVGIGIATFIEQTALGAALYGPSGQPLGARDTCTLRIEPDGGVRCAVGCTDQGQGTLSGIRQIVAAELGVTPDRVHVSAGDSDGPYGGGAWASRGLAISGEAALRAARLLREKILNIAAAALQTDADALALHDGAIMARSNAEPRMALAELARLAYFQQHLLPPGLATELDVSASFIPTDPPYYMANGVQASRIEVDLNTGLVRLCKHWVVEDCGRVINPLLVDEQIRGGVVQGLGAALFEHCQYDASGQLLNASLADYLVPMAAEMPDIDIAHVETPQIGSELGAKGAGEAGTIGALAAVWCAVNDALRPLGVSVNQQPITPAVVLQALGQIDA